MGRLRAFCRMSLRVILRGEVKQQKLWSRRETESEMGVELRGVDPKLSDLLMARLKLG